MEALMIEILASLCQTGAKLYLVAMGLIGIGGLIQILLLIWVMKVWKSPGKCVRKKKECNKNER